MIRKPRLKRPKPMFAVSWDPDDWSGHHLCSNSHSVILHQISSGCLKGVSCNTLNHQTEIFCVLNAKLKWCCIKKNLESEIRSAQIISLPCSFILPGFVDQGLLTRGLQGLTVHPSTVHFWQTQIETGTFGGVILICPLSTLALIHH